MLTLKELAVLAGVSTSTVSKALNNSPDISEETRDYIVELAAQNGYQKKFRKKSASKPGISGPKIGLIYTDAVSRYYSKLIQTYSTRIHEMGGVMISCDAHFSHEHALTLCNYLDQQCHVDGIISIYSSYDTVFFPKTRAPMVGSFGHRALDNVANGQIPCDMICFNGRTGLSQAVEHLIELGHRKFAYVGEKRSILRQTIFLELMQQHGLSVEEGCVRSSDLRFEEAGYEGMRALLEEGHRPTAVICAYDDVAVGASKAILEADLRVPEDISIVGYDNSQLRLYNQKILASVENFIEDQVTICLDMLMKRITNPNYGPIQNIALQTAFVPYETVGPAPGFDAEKK